MTSRVLIGPAHLKEIRHVYGPVLEAAGCQLEYPPRKEVHAEVQMSEQELLAQLPGCAAALAGSETYTRAVIEAAAPRGLRVIARAGVGYDGVDLAAATEHGVAVAFAPGTNQDAVAEHTFLLMLALARNLLVQHFGIIKGDWPRRANRPLRGQTLGIVGLGRIGKVMAIRGRVFGMTAIACDPYADPAFVAEHAIPLLPLEDLLRQADIVSLHVPKSPETRHMINRRTLDLMKPDALLINTARGAVVNEADLYDALKSRRIAGAGLDVFENEPPSASPLLTLDNVILSAHTAGVDFASRNDMARVAAEAIVELLAGKWPAEWIVNPAVKDRFFAGKS